MRNPLKDEGPDPIDKYVGSRIRGKRTGLRISQGNLGRAIGVTFQQIQKYESGANRVGSSNLYKIAKALGVDVSFFFEGVEAQLEVAESAAAMGMSDQPVVRLEMEPMNSRHASELAHNYFRIADPQVRKRLFYLVRALVGEESSDADTDIDIDEDISLDDDNTSMKNPYDMVKSEE
ncbi:MAG: helix-turn-helix transcriptional regulator [Candidatus Binatia bacterium]